MSTAALACPANLDEEVRNDLPVDGTTHGSVPEQLPLIDEQKYVEMKHYFVGKAIVSTSSCVLTLAYIMLVNHMTSKAGRTGGVPYNLCMLSAFLATGLVGGMITLSITGAVLCKKGTMELHRSMSQGDMNRHHQRAAFFTRIIIACEYLHIGGITLLALAVFVSSFAVFEDLMYPGIFCALWASILAAFIPGRLRGFSSCTTTSTTRHNLQYHMNSHLDRKYAEGCPYSATSPATAERHSNSCKETGNVPPWA